MAGLGRKVFTAGDVLTASDVQNYMMDQSVMVFAGTAARSSAIATPTTGMTSYIGVTGTATIPQLETYTGSQWQTPYGMTQIANVSVPSSVTSVSLNNVFTSAYRNYRIVINVTAKTANSKMFMRYRVGGVDNTASTYNWGNVLCRANGTILGDGQSNVTELVPMYSNASPAAVTLDVFSPQLSTQTQVTYSSQSGDLSTYFAVHGSCAFAANTVFDGFTFFNQGTDTFTGEIRVYGYRNS